MKWIMLVLNRLRGFALVQGVKLPIDRGILSRGIELRLASQRYECVEVGVSEKIIEKDEVVLELGTGLGFLSVYIRRNTPAGRIVTFEANPDLIDYIRTVHRLNGIVDVDVRLGAVTLDKDSRSMQFFKRPNFWAGSLSREGQPISGVATTFNHFLPSILEEIRPTVLIMDIEGGELEIVEAESLGTIKKIVVELHPSAYGEEGIARFTTAMERHGFVYDRDLSDRNVTALRRTGPNAAQRI